MTFLLYYILCWVLPGWLICVYGIIDGGIFKKEDIAPMFFLPLIFGPILFGFLVDEYFKKRGNVIWKSKNFKEKKDGDY